MTLASNKSFIFSFFCGIGGAASSLDLRLFPLSLLCFSVFLWHYSLKQEEPLIHRLVRIGLFVYGYLVLVLHWIAKAALMQSDTLWIFPVFLLVIPGAFTVMSLFVFTPYAMMAQRVNSVVVRYVGFAISWFIFELLRSNFPFHGFPWYTIGTNMMFFSTVSQLAFLIKRSGMDLIAIFVFCSLYPLFLKKDRIAYGVVICNALVLFAGGLWGAWHLKQYTQSNRLASVPILAIQANVPQDQIADYSKISQVFREYYSYTKASLLSRGDVIIVWPESALVAFEDYQSDEIFAQMADLLPTQNSIILFTSSYGEGDKAYMSSFVLNKNKKVLARYNKRHLVQFGEYVPLRFLFGFLKIVGNSLDFSFGKDMVDFLYRNNGGASIRIAPIICYDIVFSGDIVNSDVDLIVNMSNEAWFGSAGLYQSLQMTRMRAIEERKPIVKVANSGISAFIDPHGKVVHSIGIDRRGFIYGFIPFWP